MRKDLYQSMQRSLKNIKKQTAKLQNNQNNKERERETLLNKIYR